MTKRCWLFGHKPKRNFFHESAICKRCGIKLSFHGITNNGLFYRPQQVIKWIKKKLCAPK